MQYEENNKNLAVSATSIAMKTVEDNIYALSSLLKTHEDELNEEDQENPNRLARLIAFGVTAIEKLLMLNLYSRNPLFLLSDEKITKSDLMANEGYVKYDMNWLFKNSHTFVKPEKMWEILTSIHIHEGKPNLEDHLDDFGTLKNIRNKYLHAFIIQVPPHSSELIKKTVWYILITLINSLPQYLKIESRKLFAAAGLNPTQIQKLLELDVEDIQELLVEIRTKFHEVKRQIEALENDSNKRDHLLKILINPAILNTEVPQYQMGEPMLVASPDGEELHITKKRIELIKQHEANLDCPICSLDHDVFETGFLSVAVEDFEHRVDSEGDICIWEDPWSAVIRFSHFYCINCGFHSDDYYFVEKFGYGEILKNLIWFNWDINEGAGRVYVSEDNGVEIEPN